MATFSVIKIVCGKFKTDKSLLFFKATVRRQKFLQMKLLEYSKTIKFSTENVPMRVQFRNSQNATELAIHIQLITKVI